MILRKNPSIAKYLCKFVARSSVGFAGISLEEPGNSAAFLLNISATNPPTHSSHTFKGITNIALKTRHVK